MGGGPARPGDGGTTARRERLVALLVLGIGVVLLLSSPTWFASDRGGVGVAQLFVGVVLLAVGGFLLRRSRSVR
ncbi:hypothetical protein GCM10027261_15020 [Geodermatophilus arenarius]|uniref:MYXO-CTERM domain-containing protein n=1 Tax=Geodermatophilus arenarius TaxID=1137990 RepID=A0ABV9LMA4_9ACTN